MMRSNTFLGVLSDWSIKLMAALLAVALWSLAYAATPAMAQECASSGAPSVQTDKADYGALESAVITGQGFACGASLSVRVMAPDGTVRSGDGLGTPGADTVTADASGAFTLSYALSGTDADGTRYVGQEGEYVVDVLDAHGAILASTFFTDSHLRFGHLTWRKTDTGTAEITAIIGLRRSAYSPQPNVGSPIGLDCLSFGDTTTACPSYTVTFVDAPNDWFLARAVVTHRYGGGGPFTAYFGTCCRITLSNGSQQDFRVQTVVDFRESTNGAPVSQLPAIVDCPTGGTCTFNVPGTQPDLHAVTFRLATSAESGIPGWAGPQPNGASINTNTGLYTLDMAGKANGQVYTSQVIMEDRSSTNAILSSSAIDFIIRVVQASAQPVFNVPPSPASGTTLGVGVGQTLTFTVQASDVDGPTLALNVIGLPTGATFSTPGTGGNNSRSSTFTWVPAADQVGAYSLIFQATDGQTTKTHAVSINVSALSVQKTLTVVSGPNPPEVGAATTYDFTITVSLPTTAPNPVDNITVTDSPAGGATYSAIMSQSQGTASYNAATNVVTWTLGTLSAGGSATLRYRVTVTPSSGNLGQTLTLNTGARATGTERASGVSVSALSNTLRVGPVAPPSNRAPSAEAGSPYSAPEGGSVPLTGSGSDPDGDPLSFAWDLDNDGIFETEAQNPIFSAATLGGPSTKTATLRVTEQPWLFWDFENATSVGSVSTAQGLSNSPSLLTGYMSQTGGGPVENWGGTLGNVLMTRFFGTTNYPFIQFTTTRAWTVKNVGFRHLHNHNSTFPTFPSYQVQLQIDTGSGYTNVGAPLTVSAANHNTTSTVDVNLALNAGTYRIRWVASGFAFGSNSGSEFFGLNDVKLVLAGLSTTDSATVNITNVAPAVNAGPDATINEGGAYIGAGSFTDPGPDTWTATVDYGDGGGPVVLALAGKTFTLNHVYANSGTYTVTVTVTDNNSGVGSDTVAVTVKEAPPVLTVGGAATYTEDGAPVVVAPSLTLTDPGNDNIDSAKVSIGANFSSAQDSLGIQGQSGASGTVGGLSWAYNSATGVLTLSGAASPATYQAALRLVTYRNNSQNPSSAPRTVNFNIGTQLSSPDNGHFYEFVDSFGIAWTTARNDAGARSLYGLQGYLATVTSAGENAFIFSKVQGNGWLGGSDTDFEGVWRWSTGPESGQVFAYANWNGGEPNNAGNEDYVHMIGNPALGAGAQGRWNDLPVQVGGGDYAVRGYVVEYGGMAGDPALQLSGSATVNVVPVNDAPMANAGGPYTVQEGFSVALTGSGSDVDSAALDYQWDLDNDGVFETTGLGVSYPGVDGPATSTVTLKVCDSGTPLPSQCTTSQATVAINNVAPTLTSFIQVAPSPEGANTSVVAQATDTAGPNDPLLFAFDCDNNGTYEKDANPNTSGTECFFADSGSYTVGVKVADGDGGFAYGTTTVVITNTAPTAFLGGDGGVNEGSTATVLFTNLFDPSSLDTTTGFHFAWDLDNDGIFDVGDGTYGGSAASATTVVPASYFADGPVVRVVRGRVLDKDGGFTDYTTNITVNNVNPAVNAGPDATINEGSAYAGGGSFADPGADTWTATVDYGDGSGPVVLALNPDKTFNLSHVYADNGTYTVTVRVVDNDGGIGMDTVSVTVRNVAPRATFAASSPVIETEMIALSLTGAYDPGVRDGLFYAFDCGDGTGFGPLGTDTTKNCPTSDNGTRIVRGKVQDKDGGFTDYVAIVAITNVTPTVDAGLGAIIDEGGTFTGPGAFADPGADTWTATVDYGDGSGAQPLTLNADKTFGFSHTYADNGTYTVKVTVTDDDGGSGSDSVAVMVNNVAPELSLTSANIAENGTATVQGAITDPGTKDSFTVVINWGEGGLETYNYPAGTKGFTLSHQYLDDNPTGTAVDTYIATASVTDKDGGSGNGPTTITVSNLAPVVNGIANGTALEGSVFATNGSFSDIGTQDTHRATVDYGDGSGAQTLMFNLDKTFNLSHTYADNGTYTVTVRVMDDDSGEGASSFTVTVSNVAPTVAAGPEATINEGSAFTGSGSFTDPGADTWTATVDYGDGSGTAALALNPDKTFSLGHVYADNGTYTVKVTVTDDDLGSGSASFTVTVRNVNPTGTLGNNGPVSESSPATVSFSDQTDPSSADTLAGFHYAFSCAGADLGAANYAGSGTAASVTCVYADNGTYTVTGRILDKDGGFSDYKTTVTVTNVAPVATATGMTVNENGTATVIGTITDPSPVDTFSLVINWGDGASAPHAFPAGTTSFSLTHQYLDDNLTGTASDVYAVSVTVTDDDGGTGSASTSVTVNNVAPVANGIANGASPEGSAFTTGGSFSDTGTLDTHTATVDYGDGSGIQALTLSAGKTFNLNHTYADNGTYTVKVTVTDDDKGAGSTSFVVVVANVSPWVSAGADAGSNEGAVFARLGYFMDPGADSWTATVDYGDGSGVQALRLNHDKTFSLSHTYADNSTYTATVKVTDDDSGVGVDSLSVVVANVAPSVDAGAGQVTNEGSMVNAAASFSDPGFDFAPKPSLEDFTASINWGDGSMAEAGAVAETPGGPGTATSGAVTGSHVYADNGTYTVTVCVTDDDGATTCDTFTVTVNNVAPTLDAGADQAAGEGATVSLAPASFNDKGTADTHTATVDWGDGTLVEIGVVSEAPYGPPGSTSGANGTIGASHVYADNGTYTVTVCVTDDEGARTCDKLTVTVSNVAPTVDAGADQTTAEGAAIALAPSTFNDKGTRDTHTATVVWGDGTLVEAATVTESPFGPPGSTAGANGTVSASHVYADNGTYTVKVCVKDDEGAETCDTLQVTVTNVAPTLNAGADIEVIALHTASVLGAFNDKGTKDTHTAVINWGDGTIAEKGTVTETPFGPPGSTGGANGMVALAHVYLYPGSYTVTMTLTDDDGGTTTDTLVVKVVGPKVMKERLVGLLTPYAGEKRIADALKEIQKSLDPTLWTDTIHLSPQHGHKVFDAERNAVQKLDDLLKDKKGTLSAAARAAVQQAIDTMMEADRILAVTRIREAQALTVTDPKGMHDWEKEYTVAIQHLAAGNASRDAQDYNKAIDNYRKAWEHAEKAVNRASRN